MKFEVPKELAEKVYKLIADVRVSGKVRKGTNEATKSVERAEARLVVIAADTNPIEIVAHLPMLCEEKKIPYVWVPTKADLGAAVGLPVGTSAVAVAQPGEAAKKLDMIVKQIKTLTEKKPEAPKEKPVEKKAVQSEAKAPAAPKEEKKPEVKKEASKPAPKAEEKKPEPKPVKEKKEAPKEEPKTEEAKPEESSK